MVGQTAPLAKMQDLKMLDSQLEGVIKTPAVLQADAELRKAASRSCKRPVWPIL